MFSGVDRDRREFVKRAAYVACALGVPPIALASQVPKIVSLTVCVSPIATTYELIQTFDGEKWERVSVHDVPQYIVEDLWRHHEKINVDFPTLVDRLESDHHKIESGQTPLGHAVREPKSIGADQQQRLGL